MTLWRASLAGSATAALISVAARELAWPDGHVETFRRRGVHGS